MCHVADAYCASKFAVEGLTEAMATTLPQTGVDVSLVEPGGTATHLTRTMQLSVQQLVRRHAPSCCNSLLRAGCRGPGLVLGNWVCSAYTPVFHGCIDARNVVLNSTVRDLLRQLEEYNDQYTEMIKTFWPKFAESLKPENGAQSPAEVRMT